MEKMYSRTDIELMLSKAFLDGKIKSIDFFLSYIEMLLSKANEEFEYYDYHHEHGAFTSIEWNSSNAKVSTLSIIKEEFTSIVNKLKIQQEEFNSKQ